MALPDFVERGKGAIGGVITLEWLDTREFVYLPLERDPLVYTFPPGVRISDNPQYNNDPGLRRIRPRRMFTDSGSIPRPVWGLPGLSPLDYVPAYVVHDWLYLQRHCYRQKKGPFAPYDEFPYSLQAADYALFDALVLIDRKRNREEEGRTPRNLIRAAVSRFGSTHWNNENGRCETPPPRKQITRTETVRRKVRVPNESGVPETVLRTEQVTVRESNYQRLGVFSAN